VNLLDVFPHLNAGLNALSSVFLLAGFYFIMATQVKKHRACMLTAATLSAIFLVSYISYHSLRTYYFGLGPTRFTGNGIVRPIYFTILTSHTMLAAAVAPLVILTLYRGLRANFDKHRNIARYTFLIWLYVSITGVVVYIFLYHLYPTR